MKPQHENELTARIKSFGYAFEGIRYVIRNEHNAWIHAFFTVAVIVVGLWVGIDRWEWAVLVAMFALVWLGECVNTAVEAVVNMTSPDPHPLAKVAKDTAAGGVLIAAIAAAIVGLLILGPPLLVKLGLL